MHLGGIGTGNVEIGCDGRFTTWQLFNTLRDGQVPMSFVVKAGGVSRLLQTDGGPNWPRVKQIEMNGEYPIATLRFIDPALPVKLSLSAFTPFAPLDAKFSSQPLAALLFRVENPTAESQTVSLAGMLQNAVGYEAIGAIEQKVGGNVNEPFSDGSATGVQMRIEPGKEATIDRSATIFVGGRMAFLLHFPPERPEQFHVNPMLDNKIEVIKTSSPAESVIWLEDAPASITAASLRAARRLVHSGATLVFSGKSMPLVEAYARDCAADTADRSKADEVGKLVAEIMPGRFTKISAAPDKKPYEANALVFENLKLHADAKAVTLRDGFNVLIKPLGKGQVVLVAGPMIAPERWDWADYRHRAYGALCELVGAKYTPPQGVPASACGFGTLALAALGHGATVLPACDDCNVAWEQFQRQGKFSPAAEARPNLPTPAGKTVNAAVAVEVVVPPGGSVEVPFFLAWRYPNNYQQPYFWAPIPPTPPLLGCYYATLWDDARAVVRQAAAEWPESRRRTETFRKTFYDSTLPYWMLDCITSQAATIRHVGVVFRLADGDVYGWEGSNGCCQPTCTHVWGYEQSLARLFPDLEKLMRRIDFKHQQEANGGVHNRTDVPSPPHPTSEGPFTDGHASCILKAYREALNHPDDSFFKEYWPNVKLAVEYLIGRDAASNGGKPQGVLVDDQHNTYDEALHGVTSFISGYYLAALRAGEEWAVRMGDGAAASRFHEVFLAGRENVVKRCWNGEYFQQDLPDYMKRSGEVGPGCMADQLIGQWWAHQLGLGYILPKEKVQAALRAVFKYNWVPDLTGFKHSPRAFAGAKDKGLVICTWPKGGRPPHVMLYSDEVWTGIEYQVAAHMIYEGMIEESLAIVCGARDRYDGIHRAPIPRNPWNEIECGGHYARAMSSWSLLLAASGFRCDGPAGTLEFAPIMTPERFKSPFTGPESWGSLEQVRADGGQRNEIRVVEGRLAVATVRLTPPAGVKQAVVTLAGASVPASMKAVEGGASVSLTPPVVVKAGDTLVIALS
jgi:uncharacterized protein (DUF608 family)